MVPERVTELPLAVTLIVSPGRASCRYRSRAGVSIVTSREKIFGAAVDSQRIRLVEPRPLPLISSSRRRSSTRRKPTRQETNSRAPPPACYLGGGFSW